MNNTTIIEQKSSPPAKTPGTRLLDLLAGWGDFVDQDEVGDDEQKAMIDPGLDAYEIGCMYQEAASEVMELDGDAESEAVRRWVLERILPALLRNAVNGEPDSPTQ